MSHRARRVRIPRSKGVGGGSGERPHGRDATILAAWQAPEADERGRMRARAVAVGLSALVVGLAAQEHVLRARDGMAVERGGPDS